VHVTPAARLMIDKIAAALPGVTGLILRQLANPALTNTVLDLLGERVRTFDPLFHNTVSPTILRASQKINVIPSEVSLGLDGRILPGYRPEDLLSELRQVLGGQVELEVIEFDPGPAEPQMGLFDTLADILRQADPGSVPVPLLLSGVTDARFFSTLGIQTYGYLPMRLPEDFNFSGAIHAGDERIPVDALDFGAQAIYQALNRFGKINKSS
jgi:acetylornithine deacetylase/succinyl-diaminopimelate desuccinylase-like protein